MDKPGQSNKDLTSLSSNELSSLFSSIRDSEELEGGISQLPEHPPMNQERKIEWAAKRMEEIFDYTGQKGIVPLKEVENVVMPVIKQAADIPHLYHLFYELKTKDEYTYQHTVAVGIIASLIGKWLNLQDSDLKELALGATLHDIGKAKIPSQILNKPGKLTREEYQEMKRHTLYGYELLKDIPGLDKRIPRIALQHHEREDGGGYPIGLHGKNIDLMAKIVAIADVFHAMSSTRVYREAEPFHLVIDQMQNDVFGKFDPKIMWIFLYRMMLSLVGRKVLLSNGEAGSILMVDQYEPLRALVRTGKGLVDLRFKRDVRIERILKEEDEPA
ncbi:HD-GYP domain-containing protein [Mesobacillus foraminis]|uniref:HD-GYP domain-containing protein n=1 Tax=Mesobacillus foraminis TaxID=279826 RepID=UPI000EF48C2D|nr:HD-GYP domain-containing protein [Mesobacillus foraminis]